MLQYIYQFIWMQDNNISYDTLDLKMFDDVEEIKH